MIPQRGMSDPIQGRSTQSSIFQKVVTSLTWNASRSSRPARTEVLLHGCSSTAIPGAAMETGPRASFT